MTTAPAALASVGMLPVVRRIMRPGSSGVAAVVAGREMPIRRWPERRAVVLTAAAALFAAIVALRAATADVNSGVSLLLVIPTAMVALELGLLAGVATALASLGAVIAWSAATDAHVGVTGFATRAVVFLFVGALTGRFSDRMRAAGARQQRLLASGLALARLTDGDQLAGVVARQVREVLEARAATVELKHGPVAVDGTLGRRPVRVPIEARGERLGEMTVEPVGHLVPEDRAALSLLAAQAAIAADNQRLLIAVGEKAALEAQLAEAHRTLSARSRQLREVLVGQEDERHKLALRLHEDAAQAMAAILLGLRALERDLDSDAVRPRLEQLRGHVDATLVDLRNLAVTLRPSVLDLGLDVALRRLGEKRSAEGLDRIDVSVGGGLGGLATADQAALYRVVEEALDAYGRPRRARVTANDAEFAVTVEGDDDDHARPERVAIVAARVELLGGTLHVDGKLCARIPLAPRRAAT